MRKTKEDITMDEMKRQEITLEKIDLVRQRMTIGYKEAREALEISDGDLVGALVYLEEKNKAQKNEQVEKVAAASDQWKEEIVTRGGDLIEKVKSLIAEGNATKIRIKQGDKLILEIPVLFGTAGVILLPQLAAIGAIAALFAQVTIEVQRSGKPNQAVLKHQTADEPCCCEESKEPCCFEDSEEPCCNDESKEPCCCEECQDEKKPV
jgi:hypothetical protein